MVRTCCLIRKSIRKGKDMVKVKKRVYPFMNIGNRSCLFKDPGCSLGKKILELSKEVHLELSHSFNSAIEVEDSP